VQYASRFVGFLVDNSRYVIQRGALCTHDLYTTQLDGQEDAAAELVPLPSAIQDSRFFRISGDGSYAAGVDPSTRVLVWATGDWSLRHRIEIEPTGLKTLYWQPDGRALFGWAPNGALWKIDPVSGTKELVQIGTPYGKIASTLDGDRLVTSDAERIFLLERR
jgi:hypothetical protein